jgi:glycosyltransferase involved in cell wall biosynthesis
MGLIYSLNKGIELAKGDYIARMDADDISLPHRFSKQKAFLDKHQELALAATTVQFINDEGESAGVWELDQRTTTPSSIRKSMPVQNCIAHPTVMARAEVLKKHRYSPARKNIEDYDLWLRLLAAGLNIGKVKEPELLYRVHKDSVTEKYLRRPNFFYKHAGTKFRYFMKEASAGRINSFTLKTLATTALDLVKGISKSIRNLSR